MANEKFEVIKNANPSLVKNAQAKVGVAFGGESLRGLEKNGKIKLKPNAKDVPRIEVPEYKESDNTPQVDTNPLSPEIKDKNDEARNTLIPLLNPMSKIDGIRLNSIELEINTELAVEKAKPEPDQNKIDQLDAQKKVIDTKRAEAVKGREGIVFPPKV
jgi:hypothetical protein